MVYMDVYESKLLNNVAEFEFTGEGCLFDDCVYVILG